MTALVLDIAVCSIRHGVNLPCIRIYPYGIRPTWVCQPASLEHYLGANHGLNTPPVYLTAADADAIAVLDVLAACLAVHDVHLTLF